MTKALKWVTQVPLTASAPAQSLHTLETSGWTLASTRVARETIGNLRLSCFTEGSAGTRCLLDNPDVRAAAIQLRAELAGAGFLNSDAVAIQAIAFDKTPEANWKVIWHQDVMFPFAAPVTASGFEVPSKKEGIDYARPPLPVLENLLAVRLHLDDCDDENGPLRVSPGSHRHGVLKSTDVQETLARHGHVTCLAREGEALLMKPLLLHASSQATTPRHRRVLHFVFYAGPPLAEPWHRSV